MVQDSARHGAIGLPGIAFTIASCMAYSIMKGVMMPAVSAGSNQVGASETCDAMRSWPSGAAPAARGAAPISGRRGKTENAAARGAERGRNHGRDPLLCAALQAEVFVGRGIGMPGDQAEVPIPRPADPGR